jgi:hypothetical protein
MCMEQFEKPRREELGVAGTRVNYDKLDVDGIVWASMCVCMCMCAVDKRVCGRSQREVGAWIRTSFINPRMTCNSAILQSGPNVHMRAHTYTHAHAGLVSPAQDVADRDIIIGKTELVQKKDEYDQAPQATKRDASTRLRHNEHGVVDQVRCRARACMFARVLMDHQSYTRQRLWVLGDGDDRCRAGSAIRAD